MFRNITMLIIAILLVLGLSACRSGSTATFHAPQNLHFQTAQNSSGGPTRITWSDRELVFYPFSADSATGEQNFMMVDIMGDRSIEYILRNDRLEEARFSLPDGSLVRFDLVGMLETGSEPIVYHCTPHSQALYQMSALPEDLARSIAGFNTRFAQWNNQVSGTLYCSEGSGLVPFERILKSVCCGVELL